VPSWVPKGLYLFSGVLLPCVCLVLSFVIGDSFLPSWQTDDLTRLAGMFFSGPVALPFFPLLVYSMTAMVLLLLREERFAQRFAVRLGVYTGVALGLQFSALASVYLVVPAAFAPTVGLVVVGALKALDSSRRWRNRYLLWLAGLCVLGVLVAAVVRIERSGFLDTAAACLLGAGLAMLMAAPYWAFLAYVFMSLRVRRRATVSPRSNAAKAAGAASWTAAYSASWWLAVRRAADVYATLPEKPPDCYVATAAARGHPWLVKSARVWTPRGSALVNDQIRTLKCAELALKALAPRAHRAVRALYDIFGPLLAREIRGPVAADLVYLSLKPVEWLCRLMRARADTDGPRVGRFDERSERLAGGCPCAGRS
jgi:hypothetical protein